jgi:hypothetical protein
MERREMILAYVPEAEYLSYIEALYLAINRDEDAADAFVASYEACQS